MDDTYNLIKLITFDDFRISYPMGQIEIRVGTGRYLFDAMNGGAIL